MACLIRAFIVVSRMKMRESKGAVVAPIVDLLNRMLSAKEEPGHEPFWTDVCKLVPEMFGNVALQEEEQSGLALARACAPHLQSMVVYVIKHAPLPVHESSLAEFSKYKPLLDATVEASHEFKFRFTATDLDSMASMAAVRIKCLSALEIGQLMYSLLQSQQQVDRKSVV